MATIDELMQGKQPGEIKITHAEWKDLPSCFFKPFFKDKYQIWFGLGEDDEGEDAYSNRDDWYLWQEPRKKIKRWLWVSKSGHDNLWSLICGLRFFSEEELKSEYNRWRLLKKLEWSETEFEE